MIPPHLILKWWWHYGDLLVYECHSLVDVLRHLPDNDDQWVECVEVWGPQGRYAYFDHDQLVRMALDLPDEPPLRPPLAQTTVEILTPSRWNHPDGSPPDWKVIGQFASVERANEVAARLRLCLRDRVRRGDDG